MEAVAIQQEKGRPDSEKASQAHHLGGVRAQIPQPRRWV